MPSPERRLTASATLASLGGALGVAWFVYTRPPGGDRFLEAPGVAAIAVTSIALFAMIHALFSASGATTTEALSQRGRDSSTLYQAGHDLTIHQSEQRRPDPNAKGGSNGD